MRGEVEGDKGVGSVCGGEKTDGSGCGAACGSAVDDDRKCLRGTVGGEGRVDELIGA